MLNVAYLTATKEKVEGDRLHDRSGRMCSPAVLF
jgi:hypothetical protein